MAPYIDIDKNNEPVLINVVKTVKKYNFKALNLEFEKRIKVLEKNFLALVQLKLENYELTEQQLKEIARLLEDEKKKKINDELRKLQEKEAEEKKQREYEENKTNPQQVIPEL